MGWRGSIVVRQAVVSTLVMIAAVALIAVVARAVVIREQRVRMLATIDVDIAGLVDGMARGGADEVGRRIADRTALPGPLAALYLLADRNGRRLAGNLTTLPDLNPAQSASGDIGTAQGAALARATRLRGDYRLIVARPLAPALAVADGLTVAIVLTALPAALVSIAIGGLVARGVRARLHRLDNVLAQFAHGDRSMRNRDDGKADELSRLAASVDRHLDRTQQLIEAQRQISENIAHELRTPLGHLDMRLLSALDACEDDAIANDLHEARARVRSIVSLFDALLDIALTEPVDGSAAVVFDLSDRLVELAELYHASAEEAGLSFTQRIAPGVMMPGEPMAMTRAVANLLDNAFKFTSSGSHVRLTLAAGPRITVEDDGPGIGSADPARIFERFHKSPGSSPGHGLGLALVKVIAARHGLQAWYEDARPGARFVIAPGETA